MDNCKELIEKYNQDYRLDKETKQKAEELFMEYISKKQDITAVSLFVSIFGSRILMSIRYHFPPSFYFRDFNLLIYSQRTIFFMFQCEMQSLSPLRVNFSKLLTTS
jgi:hypothetical protein